MHQAVTNRFSCATLGAKLFYHITCAPQYNRVLFTTSEIYILLT
nr:MAG TPA: hypothetical protein [Caudoviricetes sp.]